jgi:multiple sugar transport system permease protein
MSTSADVPKIPATTPRTRFTGRIWSSRIDYLFILPGIIIFGAFIVWPMIASFYYSLLNWTGFGANSSFVGLANYRELM